MRNSRQITVLRSLFKTLHPILESGLAPARRLLTSTPEQTLEQTPDLVEAQPNRAARADTPAPISAKLERTFTDEHLVVELDNITRQISLHGHTAHAQPAGPQRGQRRYSRDTLLALLEEAKVRIQVLETELELARGFDETIPMLTEEWQDETPTQHD